MDETTFWSLIAAAREDADGDDERVPDLVRERLTQLTPDEIVAFDILLDECMAKSYRNDLWAAAYLINCGCSDDGFDYFRAWLISRGQSTFQRALEDPASLEDAIVMDPGWDADLEEFLYVARQAYETVTGAEMPARPLPAWALTGANWSEDTVETLFPALSRKAEARFAPGDE